MTVSVRSYLSPTLVLLAFDWPEGQNRDDFLGFAIKRTPGFVSENGHDREASSWLPNRLTFKGAVPSTQADAPSNTAPIQKFMWWDARIDEPDREKPFAYKVYPVVGTPDAPQLLEAQMAECKLTLPAHIEAGIGTWFNRAVVSSQAFARKVAALHLAPNEAPPPAQALRLRTWLANDLQEVFSLTLAHAHRAAAAVYHLTDPLWAIPAFAAFGKEQGKTALAIVYDSHEVREKGKPPAPSPNQPAVDQLADVASFAPRDKTHIMHDKFIVVDNGNGQASPARLLTGSANFTTEGITEQANVLHLFDSPELATLYSDRAKSLAGNPSIADTAKLTHGWSQPVQVGTAQVRAIFSPEPKSSRLQIDTIVDAIGKAKHSVVFCLFMPTDAPLRDACFAAGDKGLMMFGLVNHISAKSADAAEAAQRDGQIVTTTALANMELYHRSRDNRDVIDAEYFSPATVPAGFEPELRLFPGEHAPDYAPVIIHHKFLVIDAESANPIVYTGSANMSNNSEHFNDENLLEIRDRRIAGTYLAEFLRLYEHYRARALAIDQKNKDTHPRLALQPNGDWAKKYFVAGSPEAKARIALAHGGD
ncbi:phosphatidylserine/phosphatidylglycerophosphate/cardiolipin synthase-like enzyme [Paraburkholderia sp. GAS199]|uniref:phospholipase D-like domain-containing protein n=1 Tax=Paraburkholderia sp. GAS199 TaxID=3035126 RepID=UPI003D1D16D0